MIGNSKSLITKSTSSKLAYIVLNGLSNFFTVRMCKAMLPDMKDLQSIDEYLILLYQTFNIGFGVFIFIILMFFGVSAQ